VGEEEKRVMPIYVWPEGADLSKLKEAVLSAKLGFKVKPFWFTRGVSKKCIVIGDPEGLPVTVDYVAPITSKAMSVSVEWFFGSENCCPKVHTAASRLSEMFGNEIVEIYE
jgi:hypothetical protein